MQSVRLFCLFFSGASFVSMVIGLIRPWWLLWWEDVQNRKKIFQVYGTLTVVFFLAYEVIGIFI
ncbi:MAG: hypothetical protein M9954_00375 [Cyclobacteriaceae bacterium]|nr:hypothetical protein [Cyclobacteriaceae bacterium]MCB9237801.1 hypothetical protein [Flammeovirgaceae bacterium]MCB0498687.1 hypothetical protein [Cyclobacteriaceae bacterium]MCO5270096.1 hypothetical protein [Cyclobacteriaceae bacterium]MCW5903164.1 hypothetical protein [Cyclobacteriaceae bacterium]